MTRHFFVLFASYGDQQHGKVIGALKALGALVVDLGTGALFVTTELSDANDVHEAAAKELDKDLKIWVIQTNDFAIDKLSREQAQAIRHATEDHFARLPTILESHAPVAMSS